MSRTDPLTVTGLVLSSRPAGEYDRRIVLLTRELGRISCFANGARRLNSPLASVDSFCFGTFSLREGRSAYAIQEARITARFTEIRQDIEAVCYGSYFLEVMDYVTRENNDESQMLLLLYQSLRALQAENIPNRLVRSVFEIKTAALEGEYFPPGPEDGFLEASLYAMRFIVENPPARLYTFRVSEEVLDQLEQAGHVLMQRLTGHTFSSLEMLELLRGPMA